MSKNVVNLKTLELSAIVLAFTFGITTSCISNSPVGTYRADMTLFNSGNRSTYVINGDGTATISHPGNETEYTYWEYLQGGSDIRVRDDRGGWDYIDFDDEMIYSEYNEYRSHHDGRKYTKTN